jgi:DNA-binding IclR family transcriptional regulator
MICGKLYGVRRSSLQGGHVITNDTQRPRGAIEKAFALLAELQSAGEAVRISELGRRLDLPKSTAHRIVRILVESGLATQIDNRYQAMFSRRGAGEDPVHASLWRELTPFVCDVLRRTGLTASVAVLDETEVVIPYTAYAHDNVQTDREYSGRDCAYSTAAGRLLLAFDANALRQVASARMLDPTGVAELSKDLFLIRRRGFSSVASTNGSTCIAIPLLGVRALPRVALTARGATSQLNIGPVHYVLRQVADAATAAVLTSPRIGQQVDRQSKSMISVA